MTFGSFGMRHAVKLAGVLAVFGSFAAATPAAAGPTIVGTTYVENSLRLCGNQKTCMFDSLTVVPAGKVLHVSRMSCAMEVSKAPLVQMISFGKHAGAQSNVSLPMFTTSLIKLSETATTVRYQFNFEPVLPITANARPGVIVHLSSVATIFQMLCTVSGTLLNA